MDAPDVFVKPDALRDVSLPMVQLLPDRFLSRWFRFERRIELVYERFIRLKSAIVGFIRNENRNQIIKVCTLYNVHYLGGLSLSNGKSIPELDDGST